MAAHGRHGQKGTGALGLLLAIVFFAVAVCAVLVASGVVSLPGSASSSQEPAVPASPALEVKAANDYSWEELSRVSALVSAAPDDASGLAIALEYGLVDQDGVPVSADIEVPLSDGTLAHAQLVGVRHDVRADGTPAGLTYMLSVVADQPMCATDSTEGGWEKSGLRSWAASVGKALLPAELSSRLVAVGKATNNVGVTEDAAAVTVTTDELWCFSAVEACGPVTWFADEYGPTMSSYDALVDAEGSQYAYFASRGVTGSTGLSGALALTYRGQAWPWWYRTPYPYVFMGHGDSGSFFQVTATGFPSSVGLASSASGVVLGFCL